MKKRFVLFLLCLVLSAGVVVTAAGRIQATADQVTVTTVTQRGDPALLQGLTARQSLQLGQDLLWDLTISPGEATETQVAFSSTGELPPAPNHLREVSVLPDLGENFGSSVTGYSMDALLRGDTPAKAQFLPLYAYAAQRTQPGETHTEVLAPRDFLDCYPIQTALNLASEATDYGFLSDLSAEASQQVFQEFFSFPIPADARWTVTVTKNQEDRVTELSLAPGPEEMNLETLSAVGTHTAYFTLVPSCWTFPNGTLPDFGQVPGGYGIYRLDYTETANGRFQPDLDSLGLAYPLDPTAGTVTSLTLSPDERALFLVVYAEGAYTCSVLDPQTMALRQTFSIPAEDLSPTAQENLASPADACPVLVPGEGCLLALGVETFHLFSLEADGSYQPRWSAPRPAGILVADPAECNLRGAWNGETLALGIYDSGPRRPGLTLLVYDDGGALGYQGNCTPSLTYPPEEPAATVVLNPERALSLSWEE